MFNVHTITWCISYRSSSWRTIIVVGRGLIGWLIAGLITRSCIFYWRPFVIVMMMSMGLFGSSNSMSIAWSAKSMIGLRYWGGV